MRSFLLLLRASQISRPVHHVLYLNHIHILRLSLRSHIHISQSPNYLRNGRNKMNLGLYELAIYPILIYQMFLDTYYWMPRYHIRL
nr:MAG TPA: hypothetical protein [Bacteriophage sp.]